MYCPYDNQDHDSQVSTTNEHIIPYALGGSNRFTISVCASCNNKYGSEIDAPFLEIFPVSYKRFEHNIESISGNLPSLLFKGIATIGGIQVPLEYEITASEREN